MEITDVKVFLRDSVDKKLKAYAIVTFDNVFVVRNIKVIESSKGTFIAMPSRKIKFSCEKCGFKNEARSRFCNQCGSRLSCGQLQPCIEEAGTNFQIDQRDVAHPITQSFRDYLQKRVLEVFKQEKVGVV